MLPSTYFNFSFPNMISALGPLMKNPVYKPSKKL